MDYRDKGGLYIEWSADQLGILQFYLRSPDLASECCHLFGCYALGHCVTYTPVHQWDDMTIGRYPIGGNP